MRVQKLWMVLFGIVLGIVVVHSGYTQEDTTVEIVQTEEVEQVEEQKKEAEAQQLGEVSQEHGAEKAQDEATTKEVLDKEQEEKATEAEVTKEAQESPSDAEAVAEKVPAVVQEPEEVSKETAIKEKQAVELVDMPDDEDEKVTSIDTIDLSDPQGNWLIKRYWFNKAESIYQQMIERVKHIFNLAETFQKKSAELDQKLFDPFYIDIGISRGELTELIGSLIEQLVEDDDDVERDEEEDEYLQKLEEEKGILEQLQADVAGVSDIDSAVNNALATFNERANLSRNYQSKAWHLLRDIAHELNDKKARELYFTIKSLAQSVMDIEEYITSPFTQYFDELSQKADEQINRIKQEVAVLKQKGIDLKQQVSDFEDEQLVEQLEEAEQQGRYTAELEQQGREKKERGFFSSIGSMVQYMWNAFYDFLKKLFIPAKKQDVMSEVEAQDSEEQKQDETQMDLEEGVAELELVSDAEKQEAMTAGTEEVELIKSNEESNMKTETPESAEGEKKEQVAVESLDQAIPSVEERTQQTQQ